MGLFDSYFDPEQFQASGGLLGRLLSLQGQQDQYQPGAGFDPQSAAGDQAVAATQTSVPLPVAASASPSVAQTPLVAPTPDYGQTQNIAIGNYQMPQFGRVDGSQAVPLGANLGDRLSAGFQSWAHTPVGSPFAALANGIAGLSSGQRTGPAGIAQQNLQPGNVDPANASQDLNARYQALRSILGDRNAMLAIVHPEVGQSLMAQALARQTRAGNNGAEPAGDGQPGVAGQTNPAANGPSPASAMPATVDTTGAHNPASLPRKSRNKLRL